MINLQCRGNSQKSANSATAKFDCRYRRLRRIRERIRNYKFYIPIVTLRDTETGLQNSSGKDNKIVIVRYFYQIVKCILIKIVVFYYVFYLMNVNCKFI